MCEGKTGLRPLTETPAAPGPAAGPCRHTAAVTRQRSREEGTLQVWAELGSGTGLRDSLLNRKRSVSGWCSSQPNKMDKEHIVC